jgi:hypothetical protein
MQTFTTPFRFEEAGYNDGPCIKDANGQLVAALFWPSHPPEQTTRAEGETYLIGSRMAAAINGIDPDDEDVYEMGKRDGYEEAVQEIDIATGGDGEFCGSTVPGGTVDVEAMMNRIAERVGSTE